ncbi:small acid-soluble spore protein O [Ureibacillus composti]
MSNNRKSNVSDTISDKQAVRKNLPTGFDHELANDPLSAAERANNKKTKKRQ